MAVNKVEFGGEVLIDLTGDTVTPEALLSGYSAHDASGKAVEGKAVILNTLEEIKSNIDPLAIVGALALKEHLNDTGAHKPKIVTWADGTDEEIGKILAAHYAGEINIHDYWAVGDERVVHLNAMPAEYVGEAHVEQDVTMVLMNAGGKELVEPVNGVAECAFIVGQKNSLNDKGGYMDSSGTNNGGWDQCKRRAWCNATYRNSIPETLRNLFKLHKNITASGIGSGTTVSQDYFALASEKEVFGTVTYADATAEAENIQFEWYKTATNRLKKFVSNKNHYWRERSPHKTDSASFCVVDGSGVANNSYAANQNMAISPFGCI